MAGHHNEPRQSVSVAHVDRDRPVLRVIVRRSILASLDGGAVRVAGVDPIGPSHVNSAGSRFNEDHRHTGGLRRGILTPTTPHHQQLQQRAHVTSC